MGFVDDVFESENSFSELKLLDNMLLQPHESWFSTTVRLLHTASCEFHA